VELLRHLRDVTFRETAFGRRFIKVIERAYSVVAPPLVRWLAPHVRLQSVLRRFVLEPALTILSAIAGVILG